MTNTSPWTQTAPVATVGTPGGTVTLVEGQTFCVSDRAGDIAPGVPEGLFILDTRVLSRWQLRVNGHRLEPIAVSSRDPFAAVFVGRVVPPVGKADSELVVFRHRHVGRGLRERLVITNYGIDPAPAVLELVADADFADVFEVKEGRVAHAGRHSHELDARAMRFGHTSTRGTREVAINLSDAALVEPGLITWRRTIAPGEHWELCTEIVITVDGTTIEPRFRCGVDDAHAEPNQRLERWRANLPVVDTDHAGLGEAINRAGEDLGSLRIFDPDRPEQPILAAGAPWFMTVFGRDSILTAWMTLIADPSLALGVLETLARFQGDDVNPETEEEPGRILHEIRFEGAHGPGLARGHIYYGTVDATPLFVMLLGELRRWGLDDPALRRLLAHADRALAWIDEFGDRDGDGYVEYQRATPSGLANQGWKDSWDGIRFTDGRFPQTPIALCEVQGYVYAAYVARAHFANELGDTKTCDRYRAKAAALRRRFNEDFWLDEHGWYALGLDADKQPIDALASNIGHCLWTGIIEPDRAAAVAERLLSPELFSGWGVRTLATSMAAYNPVSYHNGTVWPHDNAICAAGLARYGHIDAAHRIIEGQLAACTAMGGRLPELFAGFARDHLDVPASYPASCSPQAWASAAPLLWLRVLLRLDPWASRGQVSVQPQLPDWLGRLDVAGVTVAGSELRIRADGDNVEIDSADTLKIVRTARAPLSALIDEGSK